MRVFAVVTVALFVITSMVREYNDKGFELILSQALPRYTYYFGKSMGFNCLAAVITVSTGALLLIYSDFASVLAWSLSLMCELFIVVAASILCLFTFNNITLAFLTVMGFYVLSRCMYAIQLISTAPLLETGSLSQDVINFIIDAIAFLLPELHNFTRSEWLIYGNELRELFPVLAQTLVYLLLLTGSGLFDLYRRDS